MHSETIEGELVLLAAEIANLRSQIAIRLRTGRLTIADRDGANRVSCVGAPAFAMPAIYEGAEILISGGRKPAVRMYVGVDRGGTPSVHFFGKANSGILLLVRDDSRPLVLLIGARAQATGVVGYDATSGGYGLAFGRVRPKAEVRLTCAVGEAPELVLRSPKRKRRVVRP